MNHNYFDETKQQINGMFAVFSLARSLASFARSLSLSWLNKVVCSSVQLFATKTNEIIPMLSQLIFFKLISTLFFKLSFRFTFDAAFSSVQSFPLNRGSVCLVIIP